MGMILSLIRVSSSELDSFLEDSSSLEELFYDEENFTADWNMDLGKDWDGIQYLLSGKSSMRLEQPLSPIDRVMFTYKLIDEEQDLGYGPAQYLTSEEVKETSAALLETSFSDFSNRYNASEMERLMIYPGGWANPEVKEYLFEALKRLISFYSEAAKNNQAVVSIMS